MNNDLISREWLKDAFDNLCCHNCKMCRNFRIEECSFYRCALIDNAPTANLSLNLDNITDEDVEKFKMIWQRATGKGLCVIHEERQPDIQMGGWIPVSERLPEQGNTSYLVTVDYGDITFSCQRFFYNAEIGWNDDSVIAWQPLPEPYCAEVNV